MFHWLLRTIGVSDEFREAVLAVQHPAALWAGLVLLVPAAGFIFWWQRRNLPTAPPPLRIALSVCRVLILAALVAVLAGPYLKLDEQSEKKPIVAILLDHSQSMQLPAGPFESEAELVQIAQAAGYRASDSRLDPETRRALNRISRAKLAHLAVQTSAKSLLEPLAKKYDVRFYSLGREATPLGIDKPAQPELPEPKEWAPATHLGDAITHVLNEAGGRQVAGIVLFSDGQQTGGRSTGEAARESANAGTPIFAVPVGSSTRLHDVAIVDVFATDLVSVGDTARVAVTIESQGFDKRPVKVELKDGDKLLDSKELALRSTEQQQVELSFQATKPGAHYLTVQVPPLPEEPEELRANNTDTAYVRVSEEKIRVLHVEGLPRWDFRFLKNSMRRDHGLGGRTAPTPDIVLEAEWRRRPTEQQAAALPRTLEQLAEYHTLILGDVSPRLLRPEFVELLAKAVREKGVGLIVEAGPLAMPHGHDERLQDLLPVRLRRKSAGLEAIHAPFRIEVSPEGATHESMRFYDDAHRNQNVWSHMPSYYWCAAVERAAPAAAVLARNPSVPTDYGKMPVIAHHFAGQGRVLFVGTDSTWLWRQNVGDRFFYKFWGQAIRFVARRDPSSSKKSCMEVRPIRAQPGEQAQIELMAFSADGTPRTERTLSVQVLGGGSTKPVELAADSGTKGRYTGKSTLGAAGEYRVTYQPGAGLEPVEARIRVTSASEELRHPNVNRPAMDLLAITSGGRLVELPDLASIPDQIKGETQHSFHHREATLWDNWLMLALVIGIYSLDVGLRRLTGLS